MPTFGITGGIATGKSLVTQTLCRSGTLPATAQVFDADACARELVVANEAVRQRIRERFGGEVFAPDGQLDRTRLRDIVFHDQTKRRALEAILHPVIRDTWLQLAENARGEKRWLLVDIPLLFETAAAPFFDTVIVVACSAATQHRRLAELRKLPPTIAEKIVAAQMPLSEKIARADHVIWNDGTPSALECQTALLGNYLAARYG